MCAVTVHNFQYKNFIQNAIKKVYDYDLINAEEKSNWCKAIYGFTHWFKGFKDVWWFFYINALITIIKMCTLKYT